eukprot:3945188-Alexandrium_andersonii.AAC.1
MAHVQTRTSLQCSSSGWWTAEHLCATKAVMTFTADALKELAISGKSNLLAPDPSKVIEKDPR